jgi:predicted nucleotidyltransferase component of viral defense system
MILRDEIDHAARSMDVHIANVQRDYVYGWMLKAISEDPYLGELLVLKGGTCLRKIYLPESRFSADLDFSTKNALDVSQFQQALNRCCAEIHGITGVKFDIAHNKIDRRELNPGDKQQQRTLYRAQVHFQDFYEQTDVLTIAIYMDVAEFDAIILPTKSLPLVHPYSDGAQCQAQVRCLALEEVIAAKMKCLLQRRHVLDLFDLAYAYLWRNDVGLDRQQAINAFLKKTIFSASPGAAKGILLGLPFERFRDAWRTHVVCPIASRFEFDVAAGNVRSFLDELFKPAGTSGLHSDAFFPAELRYPILEAGAERKLVELTYKGITRQVEPYSLVFKRNDSGVAQEYFYCWDRTGGRTTQPGIRTLLNTGISSLRVTDEQFEPRFPIELSKSGEPRPQQPRGQMLDPVSRRTPARQPHRSGFSTAPLSPPKKTFTVQCPYCLRRFKRTTTNLSLSKHRSPGGLECHARSGIRVY